MKKIIYLLFFIIVCIPIAAQNKNYFVSASGDDNNDGLAIDKAWKSISKVNSFTFFPGDAVHFEGGQTFVGPIQFNSKHSGTQTSPVILKSFGLGKAIIHGGRNNGIEIWNAEFIEIRDLLIEGNGRYNNEGMGLYITTDRSDKMLPGIVIDNVDAYGFYWGGIGVGAESIATMGFLDLKITNCNVYENGMAGIQTWGAWDEIAGKSSFNHKGLYIAYTKAYNNKGISNYTSNWSGTGILMAGVENGIIEYSQAYENGSENGCETGGPVGIWLANAKNCIIQHCESYNNKAGKSYDGGGFDIDGGSQECIMQYNYSHDNEGAGFALFEWGNNIPFQNNIIRYNISQDDGRKNSYGGLTFWATDANHKLINCEVYNNTIYTSTKNLVSGTPSAIKFIGTNMSGLKIRNNIFYTTEGTTILNSSSTFDTTRIHFLNNNYFDTSGSPKFIYKSLYTSFLAFRNAAVGQEKRGNILYGHSVDPRFINPGGGKTIKPAEGGDLTQLTGYMINPGSVMIESGLDLKSMFGIDIGQRDFYNNNFSEKTIADIGANEFNYTKFQLLSNNVIKLFVNYEGGRLLYNVTTKTNKEIKKIEFQISTDGIAFNTLKKHYNFQHTTEMIFSDMVNINLTGFIYARIITYFKDGSNSISATQKLFASAKNIDIKLYPNPVENIAIIQFRERIKINGMIIRNGQGQIILQQSIQSESDFFQIGLQALLPGLYFAEFKLQKNKKSHFVSFSKK